MHSRRCFAKALDAGDARAALPLATFQSIYEWEATVKDSPAAERLALRQEHSLRVYDELAAWCRAHRSTEPPSSPPYFHVVFTVPDNLLRGIAPRNRALFFDALFEAGSQTLLALGEDR
jgi:hypothetical protein